MNRPSRAACPSLPKSELLIVKYVRTYSVMCASVKYECTVEPLYYGHFGTLILVLITEVSSIQRSFSTPQYYTGTQNGVLIIEVSAIQRFVLERFHCSSHM